MYSEPADALVDTQATLVERNLIGMLRGTGLPSRVQGGQYRDQRTYDGDDSFNLLHHWPHPIVGLSVSTALNDLDGG